MKPVNLVKGVLRLDLPRWPNTLPQRGAARVPREPERTRRRRKKNSRALSTPDDPLGLQPWVPKNRDSYDDFPSLFFFSCSTPLLTNKTG